MGRGCQTRTCFGLVHHHMVLGRGLGGSGAGNMPSQEIPSSQFGFPASSCWDGQEVTGWGLGSACDILFTEYFFSPKKSHKQTSRERTVIVWPLSHLPFPVHCSIIIFFSHFHRDVFNNGSPGSFVQYTNYGEAELCSNDRAAFWHSNCFHSWAKRKSSVLFLSVQRRNLCCN